MAWNRPSAANQQPAQKSGSKPPSAKRGIIAGAVIVVALGAACVWLFSGKEARQDAASTKGRGRIKEVAHAKAPTNAVEKAKEPKFPGAPIDWDKPYPPQAYWPDGRLKKHTRWVKIETNKESEVSMSIEDRTFKNYADRQIAFIINMRPGSTLVGDKYEYGEGFMRSFRANLDKPILILETDTPAQVELKKAVIETKADLKARYEAGEDICKLMADARKELRELSLYKQEIQEMVRKAMEEGGDRFSDADKDDLVKAANLMLKERGIDRELALPSALISKAKMIEEKRRRDGRVDR